MKDLKKINITNQVPKTRLLSFYDFGVPKPLQQSKQGMADVTSLGYKKNMTA